jgi:hypothetical protein
MIGKYSVITGPLGLISFACSLTRQMRARSATRKHATEQYATPTRHQTEQNRDEAVAKRKQQLVVGEQKGDSLRQGAVRCEPTEQAGAEQ